MSWKTQKTPNDHFRGGIYKINGRGKRKLQEEEPNFCKFKGLNLEKDIEEKLSDVNGLWSKYMEIDG